LERIFLFLIIIISCYGCTEYNDEIPKFPTGIFYGEKTIHYLLTDTITRDTVTIKFDNIKYIYSSSWSLDYGKGNYVISNDSIEFYDEKFRNTLYTWDWIISGKFEYKLADDLLVLKKRQNNQLTTCSLKKIGEP